MAQRPAPRLPRSLFPIHHIAFAFVEIHVRCIREVPFLQNVLDSFGKCAKDRFGDVLVDFGRVFFLDEFLRW